MRMPIYEYECRDCGHYFDVLQKISDDPLKFCPDCGKPELKKLLSAPRFRLKGSGWYETDFKGEKDRKRNLAEAESKSAEKAEGGEKKGAADKPAADSAKKDAATPAPKPAAKSSE
jgi:putative FmdB family regulatory protein